LSYDAENHGWNFNRPLGVQGYSAVDAPKAMVGGVTWVSASDDQTKGMDALRTGYVLKNGKAYGVIQLFSFSIKSVVPSSDPKQTPQLIEEPFRNFVKTLKESKVPLIFDLRSNGGGDPLLAGAFLSMLAKTGETYPSTTRALRVTRVMRQMIESGNLGQLPNYNAYDYDQMAIDQMQGSIDRRQEYTYAFTLTKDITADAGVGGYDEKIVTLISPSCISACDGIAMLLQAAKRTTFIGTTTNGTGAGFIGGGAFEDEIQLRDRYQLVSLRVPNRLFGYPGSVGQYIVSDPEAYKTMNSENRPVSAEIQYQETLQDFTEKGEGWYAKALENLQ
jgi:hypothetical protein